MSWRDGQDECRRRLLDRYDEAGVDDYESLVGQLSAEDEAAYLSDLNRVFRFQPGMRVLDAGAGTGSLCKVLSRLDGLAMTALEPAPAMLERLRGKAELAGVHTIEGFCDAPADRSHFDRARFDAIVSRQLGNGLFDPLTAFGNWNHWLVPGGAVVLIDGLYARSSWAGGWEQEIDALPLSACQSMAMVPYLLEAAGFRIEALELMTAANRMPSTRTTRYVVVARKPIQASPEIPESSCSRSVG
jgi:SAM-dependent methyltransferase